MEIVDRILELMIKKRVTAASLTRQLGLSTSAITDWKNGKAKPNSDSIIKISDYFDVSTDWLLKGLEFSKTLPVNCHYEILNEKELRLLQKYRTLTELEQSIVEERLQSYYLLHERVGDLSHSSTQTGEKNIYRNQKSVV